MTGDSINDEILRIKHELAAMHDNDICRIAADARRRQTRVVTLPPRPFSPNKRLQWSGVKGRVQMASQLPPPPLNRSVRPGQCPTKGDS